LYIVQQACVSVARLQEFLQLPEIKKNNQVTVAENGAAALATKASLSALRAKDENSSEVEKQPLYENGLVSVSVGKFLFGFEVIKDYYYW
jgi:hypothetical protein